MVEIQGQNIRGKIQPPRKLKKMRLYWLVSHSEMHENRYPTASKNGRKILSGSKCRRQNLTPSQGSEVRLCWRVSSEKIDKKYETTFKKIREDWEGGRNLGSNIRGQHPPLKVRKKNYTHLFPTRRFMKINNQPLLRMLERLWVGWNLRSKYKGQHSTPHSRYLVINIRFH